MRDEEPKKMIYREKSPSGDPPKRDSLRVQTRLDSPQATNDEETRISKRPSGEALMREWRNHDLLPKRETRLKKAGERRERCCSL